MKFLSLFLIFILLSYSPIFSQINEIDCGLNIDDPTYTMSTSQPGGMYITSKGVLKVLVVAVRFPDDSTEVSGWDAGEEPVWLDYIIDSTTTQEPPEQKNITHYFDAMSLDSFKVIGQAIYVEAPHPSTYYGFVPSDPPIYARRDSATKHVLQQKVEIL